MYRNVYIENIFEKLNQSKCADDRKVCTQTPPAEVVKPLKSNF